MANYFDLHFHTAAKSYLTHEKPEKRKSPWDDLSAQILHEFVPILNSQSNFTQVAKGKIRLGVMAIIPLERGFTNYWILRDVVPIFSALNKDFLVKINNKTYPYHSLLVGEIEHLQKHLKKGANEIRILRSIEDGVDNPNVLNLALSIEGSHSFWSQNETIQESLINLRELKNRQDVSFFYLTLTHVTQNKFCNHAYAAKITKDNVFKPLPNVKGISSDGLKIIDQCYSQITGKRILIDIKHMSYYARRQFYQYRKEKGYQNIPIVASHMAVTGFPFSEFHSRIAYRLEGDYAVVSYKEDKISGIGVKNRDKTCFNPWSLNLYDEEIKEIIDSDGLIGVILDQRVLGFDRLKEEYINKLEFAELISVDNRRDSVTNTQDTEYQVDTLDDKFPETGLSGRKRRHLRFLCNNILHIIKVGGAKAWAHICIGSDFDGLIDCVNNCKTAIQIPDLESDLVKMLEEMIQESSQVNYHITNSSDLAQKVRNIMFGNGVSFMTKYFSKSFLGNQHFLPNPIV